MTCNKCEAPSGGNALCQIHRLEREHGTLDDRDDEGDVEKGREVRVYGGP